MLAQKQPYIQRVRNSSLAVSYTHLDVYKRQTKVLTDAAIKGKVDPLIGLKENLKPCVYKLWNHPRIGTAYFL